MTILITGATGTVGSVVTDLLLDAGEKVRVGTRRPTEGAALSARGAEIVPLDFERPETLREAMHGAKRVFLLTPFVEHGTPLVRAAVEAARAAKVEFVLRMSAAGADRKAWFTLAREHGEGDALVAESGLAHAILQPTFFQDNFLKFHAESLKTQNAFYGASAGGATSYVSSRDIGASAAAILRAPEAHLGKTYVLTGPEAKTDVEVAAILSDVLGRSIRYVDLGEADYVAGMRAQGVPEWVIDGLSNLERVKALGYAAGISADVESLTGSKGETLRQFIERHRSAWT